MKTAIEKMGIFDRSGGEHHGRAFSIASCSLVRMMVARLTGCAPGALVHTFGKHHLYLNHPGRADRQLPREPLPFPRTRLNGDGRSLVDYRYEDVELLDNRNRPAIPAPVSV